MKIKVAPEVFAAFPGYVRHVLIVEDADNTKEVPELVSLLHDAERRIREDETFADPKSHPRVASWRDAFQSFGVNPNKCPPSVANLIRRVRGGWEPPYINTLVAIFNFISMKYVLPAGGDDLDTVKGDICLMPARGDEHYAPLGAPDQAENPTPGEIVLLDTGSDEVFCRAWCWKNGDVSKIDVSTKRVAINIDALPPMTADEGETAALEAMEMVKRFCGGKVALHRLDAKNGSVEI